MLIEHYYALEGTEKEKKDKIPCSKTISAAEGGVGETIKHLTP